MAEGIVHQDDKIPRIDHDHALRERIECGFHASWNNAGGIELTEGAFHEEEVADESRDTDKCQEAHPRIREQPLKAGYVRLAKRNLEHAPRLVAGKIGTWRNSMVDSSPGGWTHTCAWSHNLCDDRPAFLEKRQRQDIRIRLANVSYRKFHRLDLVTLRKRRVLNC